MPIPKGKFKATAVVDIGFGFGQVVSRRAFIEGTNIKRTNRWS
jgi:hypothetical protein